MKETVRALQTGALAEIAVVAFVVAFVLVCAYAFTLSKRAREHAKQLPLDDAQPAADLPADATSEVTPPPEASGDGAVSSSDDLLLTL